VFTDKQKRTQCVHGSELPQTRNTREIHISRVLCNNEVTECDERCEISTHFAQLGENSRKHRTTANLNSARQNIRYN
jgi:hypothetical protein